MDAWGIDVVVSASQKGLGAPPGLSVVVASQKALKVSRNTQARAVTNARITCQVVESRKAPITGFYCSWKRYDVHASV